MFPSNKRLLAANTGQSFLKRGKSIIPSTMMQLASNNSSLAARVVQYIRATRWRSALATEISRAAVKLKPNSIRMTAKPIRDCANTTEPYAVGPSALSKKGSTIMGIK